MNNTLIRTNFPNESLKFLQAINNITNNSINNTINQLFQICNNTQKSEDVTEANISTEILLMMVLLSISLGGGYFLKKTRIKIINESLFATLVGVVAGAILSALENDKYINNITNAYVKFFLILLLPPIIFESAYNMRKKEFFKQIGTITIFAFLGTFISIIVTGVLFYFSSLIGLFGKFFSFREALAYGSLISATDPVSIISAFKEIPTDPNFFQIVLGESILNDAVSIVFYDTCVKFESSHSVFFTFLSAAKYFCIVIFFSIIIGYLIGYLTAFFLSLISGKVKNMHKVEIALMVILPWVSYLSAEMLGLSGIVSILFNGVAHATYTNRVISEWSKITIKTAYEGVASIFETLVFIFLGLGFFSFKHPFDQLTFPFVLILLLIILFSRFLNVYVCSKLANLSRSEPLEAKKQFFLWFAGCRGAMAFALSIKSKLDFPQAGEVFLTLTLIIASFTLIYSTLFLDIVLKRCGIADFCKADNFEASSLNNKKRRKNCFEKFKNKINEINERYLKRLIRNGNEELNNSSVIASGNGGENRFYLPFGQRGNLRNNEVKNSSANEQQNFDIDEIDNKKNIVNPALNNTEILDKAEKRASQQLSSCDRCNSHKYQNQVDEKNENINSNFNSIQIVNSISNSNANANNNNINSNFNSNSSVNVVNHTSTGNVISNQLNFRMKVDTKNLDLFK